MTSGPAYERWLTARAVFDAFGELADDVMAGRAPLSLEEILRRRESLWPEVSGEFDYSRPIGPQLPWGGQAHLRFCDGTCADPRRGRCPADWPRR